MERVKVYFGKGMVSGMEEKTYKAMSLGGTAGIVTGVISIIVGVACGVVMIVSGARLLAERKNILF
ncbi:MAG: hypothetical protein K2K20_02570 [Lachnospiraceae bacterium]|nr:hypothetical protein [Lachnospiraceae bacterium]